MAGIGRQGPDPTFTNEEWMAGYLADVAEGVPPYLAAEAHGVSRITLYKWFRYGGHPSTKDNDNWHDQETAEEPYRSFVEQTLRAEAGIYVVLTKTVTQKARNDGEFALKVLKARKPEDFNIGRGQPQVIFTQDERVARVTWEDFKKMTESNDA